jgi:hypothetical protein
MEYHSVKKGWLEQQAKATTRNHLEIIILGKNARHMTT